MLVYCRIYIYRYIHIYCIPCRFPRYSSGLPIGKVQITDSAHGPYMIHVPLPIRLLSTWTPKSNGVALAMPYRISPKNMTIRSLRSHPWVEESVGARVWSIVASVSLLSQEVFRGWNDQLSNFCPSILAPFDLWCRLVNLPNLHTPESHDWSSFSPRRWSGSYHVALPCTAKPLVNLVFSPKIEYEYPRNHCFLPIKHRQFRVSHGF